MTELLKNINYEDFHFLRPDYLWLLFFSVFIFLTGMFLLRENIQWKKYISPHLRKYMIKEGSYWKLLFMHIAIFFTLSSAILGLAGPTWKRVELPGKVLETPLVIILDLSQSMMANDIQPNRLERAKFKINDLIKANPQSRIALIGYAGTAHSIIPLTRDYKIINSHVKSLSPNIMPFPGSDMEAALVLADTLTSVTKAPGTVLIFSDDFTNETFQLIQNYAKKGKNRVVIVPMSTANGAKIPMPYYKNRFYKDKDGKYIISALNNTVIQKLKSLENVEVAYLTLDDSDMQLLAKNVSEHLEFTEKKQEKEDDWEDYGLWFIIPFAVLVLFWFRKGWVLYSLIFVLSFSSCEKVNSHKKELNNKAQEVQQKMEAFTFEDLWFTRDYQAQQLENKGNMEQAAETYENHLRAGVAWYKSGNFEKAIEELKKDTTAIGTYNLALAYYQNGDYAAAEMTFGISAEMAPELKQRALQNQSQVQQILQGQAEANPEEATEAEPEKKGGDISNKGQEDLGGGGQEAKKEDMEQERKEETVETDTRKGKEMEFVPDDFKSKNSDQKQKVVMQKVDDDPALFLKRKFKYQVRKTGLKPKKGLTKW